MSVPLLCYQDFKDTFVCNTQLACAPLACLRGCVIRISKILLYAIHNMAKMCPRGAVCCVIRISKILLYAIHNASLGMVSGSVVVLSGFQRYFCMQYTTYSAFRVLSTLLCYQDFKDTFVCNTQPTTTLLQPRSCCVIRISKNNLKDMHH